MYVGRPTKWGNPYGATPDDLARYRDQAIGCLPIEDLRGKDLACWCALDQPCHADVLLELANKPRPNVFFTETEIAALCGGKKAMGRLA